jgi:hypothetical protein
VAEVFERKQRGGAPDKTMFAVAPEPGGESTR